MIYVFLYVFTLGQKESVIGMNLVATKLQIQYVLALGDNFYDSGIPTDDNDPRFQETYESVYNGKALQGPWYVIAGNHGVYYDYDLIFLSLN